MYILMYKCIPRQTKTIWRTELYCTLKKAAASVTCASKLTTDSPTFSSSEANHASGDSGWRTRNSWRIRKSAAQVHKWSEIKQFFRWGAERKAPNAPSNLCSRLGALHHQCWFWLLICFAAEVVRVLKCQRLRKLYLHLRRKSIL